jgi:hypothetical protein
VESKKNIDQLFKEGLSEPDIPFNELDWDNMARKLDEQSRRKRWKIALLWTSATAAVFLIVLFWMFAAPAPEKGQEKSIAKTGKGKAQSDAKANSTERAYPERESGDQGKPPEHGTPAAYDKRQHAAQPQAAMPPAGGDGYATAMLNPEGSNDVPLHPGRPQNTRTEIQPDLTLKRPLTGNAPTKEQFAAVKKPVEKKIKINQPRNKQVILSAIVAPDVSYAQSAVGSKVSSNFGLLATYAFHPKLSVTTGAVYANKYYNSRGDGAVNYGADNHSLQINALCNVIDIPVNLNYKILTKKAFSVSLNTGLSSYIMLKEKYDYVYSESGYTESTVSMEIRNQNKHMFGVANVALSFDRRISPQLSLGVQPFMKVPLTGIGYGKADLKSTGVSFSLNMGLFPVKKPVKSGVWSRLNR